MWGIAPYGFNRRLRRMVDPEGIFDDVDRLFEGFFGGASGRGIEMYEEDGKLHLAVEAPGIDPSKVEIRVFKDKVSLTSAEETEERKEESRCYYCRRSSRRLNYEISLPFQVDPDKAAASFENGMVRLVLPKEGTQEGRVLKLGSGE
ncbi:Hsp20/alpha crystallin family protein [Thermanaerovibrio acidaminovorans]|jgi:HSP20 family protein|uniref:Heat shock protein Hsp20 n=1 Tax=Thermanaerovibrio acidaminovorans (strain ATCC 49978 / DSM 6589 / Su883) TaxID=525903 RepID=D1B7G3_THEAS|nr:Hsp20/alpha crystallin family protein [Thermanaerovibrio acidaminovorans]ACZ19954.1 heat shock protein Hsp20 [Thermanaerovibrio acidaminovorans DSM 6589]